MHTEFAGIRSHAPAKTPTEKTLQVGYFTDIGLQHLLVSKSEQEKGSLIGQQAKGRPYTHRIF